MNNQNNFGTNPQANNAPTNNQFGGNPNFGQQPQAPQQNQNTGFNVKSRPQRIKLNDTDIEPRAVAVIKGKVEFSRITRKDIDKINAQSSKYTPSPEYFLRIYDPVVVQEQSDPKLAQFLQAENTNEGFYKHNREGGQLYGHLSFRAHSSGNNAPIIFDKVHNWNGTTLTADQALTGELAQGQDIEVAVQVYQSQNYGTKALGMQAVCVPDISKVQYYKGSGVNSSVFGIQANNNAPVFEAPADAVANQTPQAPAQQGQNSQFGQQNAPTSQPQFGGNNSFGSDMGPTTNAQFNGPANNFAQPTAPMSQPQQPQFGNQQGQAMDMPNNPTPFGANNTPNSNVPTNNQSAGNPFANSGNPTFGGQPANNQTVPSYKDVFKQNNQSDNQ